MKKMRGSVAVFTRAYNAEIALKRAIESILSQTHSSLKYYLLDNGSNDETPMIAKHYEAKDNRVLHLKNETNTLHNTYTGIGWTRFNVLEDILKESGTNSCSYCDYYASLDADDEYLPDFLEKALAFMEDNDLEAVRVGSYFVESKTNEIIRTKEVPEDIILEGRDFADRFPEYRSHVLTTWGGIYSVELLKRCELSKIKGFDHMNDTAFCHEVFRKAKRAGIMATPLHKYYISLTSKSNQYTPYWYKSCKKIMQLTRDYLLDYGEISQANEDYLRVIWLTQLKYVIPRIQNSSVDFATKVKDISVFLSDEMTVEVLRRWSEVGIYSDRHEFVESILDWIETQPERSSCEGLIRDIYKVLEGY
ncbi:MAG: glycosyltransferase [Oscillospiraceae bacterium]|jgi:glycosyltransferase involved in cell wall biosynthesis|nr:glycosyltransferase [Oscillospiraceae bacterium]